MINSKSPFLPTLTKKELYFLSKITKNNKLKLISKPSRVLSHYPQNKNTLLILRTSKGMISNIKATKLKQRGIILLKAK